MYNSGIGGTIASQLKSPSRGAILLNKLLITNKGFNSSCDKTALSAWVGQKTWQDFNSLKPGCRWIQTGQNFGIDPFPSASPDAPIRNKVIIQPIRLLGMACQLLGQTLACVSEASHVRDVPEAEKAGRAEWTRSPAPGVRSRGTTMRDAPSPWAFCSARSSLHCVPLFI